MEKHISEDKPRAQSLRPAHIPFIIGTFCYVLCILFLFRHVQDPCFLCVSVFLPIMLMGADRIIGQESSLLLIIASFGAAITSIEHYCAAAIIVLAWTLYRFSAYRKLKLRDAAADLLLILIPMISGGLLAAFAVLPAFFEFMTGGYRSFRIPFYDLLLLPPAIAIGGFISSRCRQSLGCAPRPYNARDPRQSAVHAIYALICCSILSVCGPRAPMLPGYHAPYEAGILSISEIPYEFPLVSSYSYYITQDDWLSLDAGQKVEALHRSLVLDAEEGSFLPEYDAGIAASLSGGAIVSDGTTVTRLTLESSGQAVSKGSETDAGSSDHELHAVYHNLHFTPSAAFSVFSAEHLKAASDSAVISGEKDAWDTAGLCPEIVVTGDDSQNGCTITYKTPGKYRYDSLDIVSRSTDAMYEELWDLEMSTTDNLDTSYVEIGGFRPSAYPYRISTISDFTKPRLLLVKIPYSTGWKASVIPVTDDPDVSTSDTDTFKADTSVSYDAGDDGVTSVDIDTTDDALSSAYTAEIMRADMNYMAVQVPAGTYEIVMAYSLPLFNQGIAVSILSLIWVVIWLAYEKSPKRYRYFYY